MRVCTIGFTHKTAEEFFRRLKDSGVRRVIDVRLNNVSQLAGYSKKDDLKFFLKSILNIEYIHLPILAPTQHILGEYRTHNGNWRTYEEKFNALIRQRKIESEISKEIINEGCLLCSEDKPHHCHRRLVAEYLNTKWGGIKIEHL